MRKKRSDLKNGDMELYRHIKKEYSKCFMFPTLTDLADHFGVRHSTIRWRISRLIQNGLVEFSGKTWTQGSPYKLPSGAWKENE